jgi:hypothetical protein
MTISSSEDDSALDSDLSPSERKLAKYEKKAERKEKLEREMKMKN